jgi:hypothetical protein
MNSNKQYLEDPIIQTYLNQFNESEKVEAIKKALKIGISTLKTLDDATKVKEIQTDDSLNLSKKKITPKNITKKGKVHSFDLFSEKTRTKKSQRECLGKMKLLDSQLILQVPGDKRTSSKNIIKKKNLADLKKNQENTKKNPSRILKFFDKNSKKIEASSGRTERKHRDFCYVTSSSDEH